MKIKDKVLIVEDEQSISNFISMILTANGFDTIIVRTGEEALTMIASHCPDMIVLDLGLPDMDGMEVLKSVRKWSNLPVVVVSARNHEHDKVEALDYGADDYLVKPYAFAELNARVEALARRRETGGVQTVLKVGDLEMNLIGRTVHRGTTEIDLQPREFQLLEFLMRHAGQSVTRTMLLEKVWEYHFDPQTNVIDVHISRLRSKIDKGFAKAMLQTVRGAGYRLEA